MKCLTCLSAEILLLIDRNMMERGCFLFNKQPFQVNRVAKVYLIVYSATIVALTVTWSGLIGVGAVGITA